MEKSGFGLMRLLDTHLPGIIRSERSGPGRVRLYRAGDYWHAFEESACQLSRLFGCCETSVLSCKGHPFPVVMASIPDEALRVYGREHIFRRQEPEYRELAGVEIPAAQYREWHRREVLGFPPPPSLPIWTAEE